jgi:peptide chain release factor subunit 1
MSEYSASRYNLDKTRLLGLLETVKGTSSETGSLCIRPGTSKTEVEALLENILDVREVPGDMAKIMAGSPTGAVVFWGKQHRYTVLPPFPVPEERYSGTCEIEPLYTLMRKEFTVALLLLRMGAYAIGVFQGDRLLTDNIGTGLVHSRHRQGGSSSHRFERHREKQIETFFTRVCGHAREHLEPYAKNIDYLIYGGTRETVLEFRNQCHYLHEFDKKTLGLLLNIREPKHDDLLHAIHEAWSSRVIEWREK